MKLNNIIEGECLMVDDMMPGPQYTHLAAELGVSDFLKLWKRDDRPDSFFIQSPGCETLGYPPIEIPLSLLESLVVGSNIAECYAAKGVSVQLVFKFHTGRSFKFFLYREETARPKRPAFYWFRTRETRRRFMCAEIDHDHFTTLHQQKMTDAELIGRKVVAFFIKELDRYFGKNT